LLVALSCIDLSGMRGCVGFVSTKVGFVSTKRECGAGTAARRPVPPRLSGRAANDAPAMGEAFGDRRIGRARGLGLGPPARAGLRRLERGRDQVGEKGCRGPPVRALEVVAAPP